ncbi:hypothetical protein Dimus_011404 [Dionaea muscipula]
MKKLFFFRSSAPSSENCNSLPPPGKQVHSEILPAGGISSESKRADHSSQSIEGSLFKSHVPTTEQHSSDRNSCLRRSHSFSSAAPFFGYRSDRSNAPSLCDRNSSPSSSSSSFQTEKCNHSSRCRSLTPERFSKYKRSEAVAFENDQRVERPFTCHTSIAYQDFSGNSSNSSSNVSNSVLDRYIDGEGQEEQRRQKSKTAQKDSSGKWPPRFHSTGYASPVGSIKDKPRSQSFRGSKGKHVCLSPKEWVGSAGVHESPKKLAKHVVDRLSQSQASSNWSQKDSDGDVPITIEDVYGGSLNKRSFLVSKGTDDRVYLSRGVPEFQTRDHSRFNGKDGTNQNLTEAEDYVELELKSKLEEADERITFLSEEIERENFLHDVELNVPSLVGRIRNLTEEKISLAVEVASVIQSHLSERTSIKDKARLARVELDLQIQRLEKEKLEMQSLLEKELDRRSNDWSFKLEKYQSEERRLRERVRDLAEQNVMLQREVSSFKEKEAEMSSSETQMEDLKDMVNMARLENQDLRLHLSELEKKYDSSVEDIDCIKRNFREKEEECKELHRSITRLIRTCGEQEKTIDGLRGLDETIRRKQPADNFDKHVQQLQMEQVRLIGVEQALRREIESCRQEVDSLRKENINILNRLKCCGKEGGLETFKLDQELFNTVHCLHKQGLPLLNESTNLCSKLLDFIKVRASLNAETTDWNGVKRNGLDGQFVLDSDMKIQAFRRGAESVERSLQAISSVLHGKSDLVALHSQPPSKEHSELVHDNGLKYQDLATELKAERLLTSLLREKLYTKDLQVEQLEAEVATAVRGNNILRSEVQNALDTVSCLTHKMKDLEIQMMEKNKKNNQLDADLQECTNQLTITRGILQNVSKERDMMWKEVKQYSEKNMLLNSEVIALKKKIEALEEDILLREGQITILKDTLVKPIDLLANPDHVNQFLID